MQLVLDGSLAAIRNDEPSSFEGEVDALCGESGNIWIANSKSVNLMGRVEGQKFFESEGMDVSAERSQVLTMSWSKEDGTHNLVGTKVDLASGKVGGESFLHWLNKMLSPSLNIEHCRHEVDGKFVEILRIDPAY